MTGLIPTAVSRQLLSSLRPHVRHGPRAAEANPATNFRQCIFKIG